MDDYALPVSSGRGGPREASFPSSFFALQLCSTWTNLDQLDQPTHFLGKHDPVFFFLNLEFSYSMSSTAIHFFLISSPLQLQRRDVCVHVHIIYIYININMHIFLSVYVLSLLYPFVQADHLTYHRRASLFFSHSLKPSVDISSSRKPFLISSPHPTINAPFQCFHSALCITSKGLTYC